MSVQTPETTEDPSPASSLPPEDATISAPGAPCDAFAQPDIDTHDLPHGDLPTENLSRRAIVLKLLIGLIGLPIGFVLLVALLVVSAVRRGRETKDARG